MNTIERTRRDGRARPRRWRALALAAVTAITAAAPAALAPSSPVQAADSEVGGWESGCLVSATTNEGSNLTVAVQRILKCRGDYAGDVDGIWTRSLTDAVEDFQADKGLDVTGEVSPQLLGVLAAEVDRR